MNWCYFLYVSAVILGLVEVSALPRNCQSIYHFELPPPDYCTEPSQPHLGCDNKNEWAQGCGERRWLYEITPAVRNHILKRHNVFRNIVAKGTLPGLPAAARMLRMKWDDNLAKLAELAAKRCMIERLTESFSTAAASHPGYNAVFTKYPAHQRQNELKILTSHLKAWYDQYRYVTLESLKTARSKGGQEIAHFLQLMIGLNDRVGCAISVHHKGPWKIQSLICLYGCYKHENKFTYRLGKVPAELCDCGSDHDFKNLCKSYESVGDCSKVQDVDASMPFISTTTTTKRPTRHDHNRPGSLGLVLDFVIG